MSLFVILKVSLVTAIISFGNCNEDVLKNTIGTLNFRKLVEETSAENSSHKENRGSNNRLVSFLVENAKQLFSNSETTLILEPDSDIEESTLSSRPTNTIVTTNENTYNKSMISTISNLEENSENNSDSTLSDNYRKETDNASKITDFSSNLSFNPTTRNYNAYITGKWTITTVRTTDEILILEKKAFDEIDQQGFQAFDEKAFDEIDQQASKSVDISRTSLDKVSLKRSCIACDNIASPDCYDPKNKLIGSRLCDREEDICYSLHTPFGIVERGCFNANHNLTTYVCSCNLCNYISISEMPFIFTEKQDWVENVKDLSRTKRLRKSIFKEMSCLKCEVNNTKNSEDIIENANCWKGNLNKLPMEECAGDEICGIRAIKSEGYIWRGCLSLPLYNYWMTLCDTDLCNYDSFVSIYDVDF